MPDLLATADLPGWRARIAELRHHLAAALAERGWDPEPSSANYLWLPDAPGLRTAMAAQGILIRSGSSFGFPDAVRIAVPRAHLMDRVIAAIPHGG